DDYTIKVWNYKFCRCLFTLLGHLDYIRTVQFHHESPWILSASDDQTIRIWNWQSCTCISVLTGHNHYVMCAVFHPKEDLVVSASLDQTIRVWDIGALRKKTVSPADDSLRLNMKAWEVDTLRGHTNNVSCVMFHAKQDIIVSNSEDKSIRVWDVTKRIGIQTFRREHDRFWVLAFHPEMNLIAAGHDSGMIVFKLERERPAFSVSGGSLYYVKDRFLRIYGFITQKDTQGIPIRRPGSLSLNQSPKTLSYNPTENAVLLSSEVDGGSYELYVLPKDGRVDSAQDVMIGLGVSAVFVARNRFAVLDKVNNNVLVKNLKNEIVKKSSLPFAADSIFYARTGNLLCRTEDRITIFDLQQRIVLCDLQIPFIKYVVWPSDMDSVALLGKHVIVVANKKLVHQFTIHETIRVKSGGWDDNGVFIYTTLNHMKYCLPNGDSGIIMTLDVPLYVAKVYQKVVFCLDRNGKPWPMSIDTTEYMFKLSLLKKKYDSIMSMIRKSQLFGQAIIVYLQQKGFPEVALHLVKDERTRFNLALECGNIQTAVASANEIDEKDHWYRLGVEALRQGNASIVEYAYQKTKNFECLSFLYLITGNIEKLSKMMKIAEIKNDVMGQFHNSLYLGDIYERVKVLEKAGHLPLAYVTASVHGLKEDADRLAKELGDNVPSLPHGKVPSLLIPPTPVLSCGDWPLLRVTKGIFEGGLDNVGKAGEEEEEEEEEEALDADWVEDLDIDDVIGLQNGSVEIVIKNGEVIEGNDEEGGWDLELPPEVVSPKTSVSGRSSVFITPTLGMPVSQSWIKDSSLAGEHAAAGNFDTAMRLLNRQLGIKNFTPLKAIRLLEIEKGWIEAANCNAWCAPALVLNFSQLDDKLKAAYRATKDGKFTEALRLFLSILQTIPLIVVDSRREVDEVKELIVIAKEYVIGLTMEVMRKEIKDDITRQQELAAYFTDCNLQTVHLRFALVNAMTICFKVRNYMTSATFARRLIDPPNENQAKKARQVLQACERNMKDATDLNYDLRNPFVVCGATYVSIYRGQKDVSFPYCGSRFVPSTEGSICAVCDLAVV
ncbi:hypothetical protein IFM89_039873, partial [Coptis chinensis]